VKELFRPSQKRDPADWASEHRVYPESAGIPGPRDPWLTPYMIPWSSAAHNGGYRRVVAVTSAQSGKTDSMLDIIGARLDQRPAPIIYVGPTKEFLTDCPSSDNLGRLRAFRTGGSGSPMVDVTRFQFRGASAGRAWFCV
jgi:phage terminase large subunit GpA-like protein